MPQYTYTARNKTGELINGRLSADSQRSAIDELRHMGFFPINIEARSASRTAPARKQIRNADVLGFTRQLARLLESGVSLARALELLTANSPSQALRNIVAAIQDEVRGGASLHEALASHDEVFPELYSGMVRSGEASGTLATVLRRIADHYERRRIITARVWNSMMYPMFMLGIGFITIFFLLVVVIPRFKSVFEDIGQTLPLPTRMLMGAGDFFSGRWWLIVAAAVLAVAALNSLIYTSTGKLTAHRLLLKIPSAGPLIRRSALARFTRVLGTLLQNGVSILPALELATANTGNLEISARLEPVHASTREGVPLSSAFRKSGLFDPFTVDITTVAEETGKLPAALLEISDQLDDEVFNSLQRLTAILEPSLIVCLGVLVAFIVSAMLLPILQINLSSL